jgi:SAM-dependent methyltransferase
LRTQLPSQKLHPAVLELIGRPRTVLEVGSGAGVHGMLARRAGARVTGLEPNHELSQRASRLLDEVLELDPESEAAERALGDRVFDLVLIPDFLDRAKNPAALIERYARRVGKEGRLVFSVMNAEGWAARLGVSGPKLGYESADGTAPRLFGRSEAEGLLGGTGLELLLVNFDPLLVKTLRAVLSDDTFVSARHDEDAVTGFRDWSPYQAYLDFVRPLEVAVTRPAQDLFAFRQALVARRRPAPGPLSLVVGMLTMDEEPSAARMIEAIRREAPDAQLLCVDSSLKDRTPIICEELGAKVLRQLPPRGHGPAMELLMTEASKLGDALIYLDCDFTYPPSEIPKLRRILEGGADVVNAARTRSRPAAMPLANYAANRAFVQCARLLHGVPVADLHSGMRGYRSSLIRSFAFDGEGDALPIDTLLWPARSGYRVVEVPIEYQERVGESKLRKLAGTVWTFVRLTKTLGVGTRRDGGYEVWSHTDEPDR